LASGRSVQMSEVVSAHPAHSAFGAFHPRTFHRLGTATVVSNNRRLDVQRRLGVADDDPGPEPARGFRWCRWPPACRPSCSRCWRVRWRTFVDKRRLLIVVESFILVTSTALATLVWLHLITPARLLFLTFLIETGAALTAPAWQASCPSWSPGRTCLRPWPQTVWVSMSVVRSALPWGGVLSMALGIAAPFWVNCRGSILDRSEDCWVAPIADRPASPAGRASS